MPSEPLVTPYSGRTIIPVILWLVSASSQDPYSTNGPRKGPRARRAVEEEEEEEEDVESGRPARPPRSANQGSFRRPTPGAAQSNAFNRGSRSNGFASRGSKAPSAVDADERPAAPARKPKGVFAVVLYDFPGEDEDELPLREGQKVRVTRQHESGWWTGEINGKIGMFPATYVKLV